MMTAKQKVLVIHPALAPYRVDWFNRVAQSCGLVIYFLHGNVPYQNYDQERLRSRCHFSYRVLDKGFSIGQRPIRFGLLRLLRRHRPDVVVTSELGQATFVCLVACWLLGIRRMVWTDDSAEVLSRMGWLRRSLWKVVTGSQATVLVLSDAAAVAFKRTIGYRGEPISIPLLQDAHELRDAARRAVLAEPKAKRNPHAATILFVGRLVREKRVDRLLDAIATLREQLPDMRVRIVGEGDEREALQKSANAGGLGSMVDFLGHLEGDRLLREYGRADILVLPSEREPWGAVVDEALILGLPVVCTSDCGVNVLVRHGVNGYIIRGTELGEMCEAILDALRIARRLPRDALGFSESLRGERLEDSVDAFISAISSVPNESPCER